VVQAVSIKASMRAGVILTSCRQRSVFRMELVFKLEFILIFY